MTTKGSIPPLVVRDPRYAAVKVSTTVLGQVRSLTASASASRDAKVANAIGDEVKTKTYGAPDYTYSLQMELYAYNINSDAVLAMGKNALGAGGSYTLDATDNATITVEVYDAPDSTADLECTYTITEFTPLSMEFRADGSSGDHLILAISGEATDISFAIPAHA